MQPGALRALEFPQIVEVLCQFAFTPLGGAKLSEIRPATDPAKVQAALDATTETLRFVTEHGSLPLRAPADIDLILRSLAVEGRALDGVQLVGLADVLVSVEQARQAVRRAAAGAFPYLRDLVEGVRPFQREVVEVQRSLEPTGTVVDEATAELKTIRERLRKQRSRLRTTLESYLRSKDTSRYLQEQIVTDRNGRYVLVVRAEHRGAIPGIVHGSSTSGASLFLEPLSTVDINNDIVALEQQEAEEVHRILLALTNQFRLRAFDLQRTMAVATDLDVVQAKARFSAETDATAPVFSADTRIDVRAARHPLLIPSVIARLGGDRGSADRERKPPVGVDIRLVPPATALVITGPNTGGKTVALKTAGLLALMAQAGLHIPAAPGSSLPVFRSVFADIGDEQSISASLSTFSGHITNIVAMDRELTLPALVLLDELGAGTDPAEGGALGMAIVERFRSRGALVVATTHDEALKSYASTTPGVVNAGFGFDPETYAPTYRLTYGSPGRSLALEIAERLGMPAEVVQAARGHRSAREAQLSAHLAKIDQDLHALEHERRLVAREREQIADDETRLRLREEGQRQREEAFRQRLDVRIDDRLREARTEIDTIIEDLRRRAANLAEQAERRTAARQAALSTGETGEARAAARAALDALASRLHERETVPAVRHAASPSATPPRVGDRVAVASLGMEGIVHTVHDRDAEVEIRGKRLRIAFDELQPLEHGGAQRPSRVNVSVQLQPRDTVQTEINVIGCSVDEALTRTERFLDEALITEAKTLRVIHGYGTGQLRRAIADFLHHHPLVVRFAAAPAEQGGGGVTVVELKE